MTTGLMMREEVKGWWTRCPNINYDGNQCVWDAYVYEVYVADGETYAKTRCPVLHWCAENTDDLTGKAKVDDLKEMDD